MKLLLPLCLVSITTIPTFFQKSLMINYDTARVIFTGLKNQTLIGNINFSKNITSFSDALVRSQTRPVAPKASSVTTVLQTNQRLGPTVISVRIHTDSICGVLNLMLAEHLVHSQCFIKKLLLTTVLCFFVFQKHVFFYFHLNFL